MQGFVMQVQVISVVLKEHEVDPFLSGVILSAANLVATATIPVLNWFIPWVGMERSILLANIAFCCA